MNNYNDMINRPKVVIWGADNYNTLGLVRSIANDGFETLLLITGSDQGVATASKFNKKIIFTHSTNEAVEYLEKNYANSEDTKCKAVLLPGSDTISLAVANNWKALKDRFHLMMTSNPETLIRVTDKNVMDDLASKAGLLVPQSQLYHVGDQVNINFPVILKPVKYKGRKEFKTKIINSLQELKGFLKYMNPANLYQMQQFIDREYDVVIYGCRLPNGELVLAGHHTLERWSDDGGGSYGHLYPEIPDYLNPDALERFFESIGYHGLFSAEYGYKDGKAYFYEVNLRNDGFCHLSYQAGANLPLLWVCSCLDIPFNGSRKMTKSVVGINEIYDVINVWRGKISWKKYKSDLREAEAFHFYDSSDLQPYKNMHRRMWWEIPMRALLKSFRPQIIWILNKIHKQTGGVTR
jgi:predicted ATP-grasp superfamily ATP-dependent carboligase